MSKYDEFQSQLKDVDNQIAQLKDMRQAMLLRMDNELEGE
jgi:hypothetical protein